MALTTPEPDYFNRARFELEAQNRIDPDLEKFFDEQMEIEHGIEEQAALDSVLDETPIGQKIDPVSIKMSEFAEFAIKIPINGEIVPFSFKDREYLKPPYDTADRSVLLLASRQVEKSTQIGNKALGWATIIPGFQVLYVSSSATQTHVFSVDRVKEPIFNSPYLRKIFDPREQSVLSKRAGNGSYIRMRYAYLHADRVRGLRSDATLVDEIQNIIPKNIPIIEQCAFHSPWKIRIYSGTPLSMDNTIENYWDRHSTQNEWAVPCKRHGTPKNPSSWHWNILGPENIGKTGIVCAKCKKPISASDPEARWVSLQPVTDENRERINFTGFRITQLMVPWVDWKVDILEKREEYDKPRFMNEVCGLSYDSGSRPINKFHLKRVSKIDVDMSRLEAMAGRCAGGVFGGVDWGHDTTNSYTLLTLGGYMEHGLQNFFAYRFTGEDMDPDIQIEKIAEILGHVNFRLCGADYGGGFGRNDKLIKIFGHLKFARYQYVDDPKKKIIWDPSRMRFKLHRSEIMTDFFTAIKEKKIWLPCWAQFEKPFAQDILNIFSEFNVQRRMIQYSHSPGKTDDTFHSIIYMGLASMLVFPRFDILIPTKERDVSFDRPNIMG